MDKKPGWAAGGKLLFFDDIWTIFFELGEGGMDVAGIRRSLASLNAVGSVVTRRTVGQPRR